MFCNNRIFLGKEPNFPLPHYPPQELYIYYLKGRVCPEKVKDLPFFLGSWEEDGLSFLFFTKPSLYAVKELISFNTELELIEQFRTSYAEWQGGRISSFKVGKLILTPVWEKTRGGSDYIELVFDPGVVFGSGNHCTTRDCLQGLSWIFNQYQIHSVLDLGTGTGVLAIAAAKLGSSKVLAVDTNPLAVKTTKRNVCFNMLQQKVLPCQGRAEELIDIPADLFLANIHYDVLQKVVHSSGLLQKKWFILSGLLTSQADKIKDVLYYRPVQIIKEWQNREDNWHTILGKILEK